MTKRGSRKGRQAAFRLRLFVAGTVASSLPVSAWAQPGIGQPSAFVAAGSIGRDQVETFATMVGDDPNVVAQILAFHPDLIPAAVAATKARTDRRRVGTALIVSGFSALGVGLIGGLLEALSAPLLCFDDACRERQSHAESAGKTIAIAGAAAGMALAIPGFIRSAVASSAETDAIRKYRQWNPERLLPPPREPPRYSGPGSAPRSVNLPLLSLTF